MTGAAPSNGEQNDQSSEIKLRRSLTRYTNKLVKPFAVSTLVAGIATFFICVISNVPLFDPLDANMANAFLGTVAQVIAGTVAIVFTVSTLAVSIASDRYSSQLTANLYMIH